MFYWCWIKHIWETSGMFNLCFFPLFVLLCSENNHQWVDKARRQDKVFQRNTILLVLLISHYWGLGFRKGKNSKSLPILHSQSSSLYISPCIPLTPHLLLPWVLMFSLKLQVDSFILPLTSSSWCYHDTNLCFHVRGEGSVSWMCKVKPDRVNGHNEEKSRWWFPVKQEEGRVFYSTQNTTRPSSRSRGSSFQIPHRFFLQSKNLSNNQCTEARDNPIIAGWASLSKAFTTNLMKNTARYLRESCSTQSVVLLTGWLSYIAVE